MLNAAICDDDWNFCQKIEKMLKNHFGECIQKIEEFSDGNELIEEIEEGENFQLIFLDKEMQYMDGITTAEKIREIPGQKDNVIIFVTSYGSEATEIVDVHPFAYLLKPVKETEFLKKVQEAMDYLNVQERFLVIQRNGGDILLNPSLIYYMETAGKHCILHYREGQQELITTMRQIFDRVEQNYPLFVQVHKSYAVNLRYLERMGIETMMLKNGAEIPIGRKYKKDLFVKYREMMVY